MEFQDYYATLGVPRTASEKEIRSAFRKLARQFHPDVNPDNPEAEAQFKRINEANEVLSDPEKRKKYDQLGARWKEYANQPPPPRPPDGTAYQYRTASPEDLEDLFGEGQPFSDFFETFFGGGRAAAGGQPRPRPGSDLEYPIEILLAEAYRGTTRMLELQLPDGQSRRLEVKIPAGVEDGSRVRVAGQGSPELNGGPAGDLFLVTAVAADTRFERDGHDLHTRVHASLTTMLLGGEVHVPTPDGRRLALKIPSGTQDGRQFRLRGQGMPHLGHTDRKGDLHAEVHVRLPESLTESQRELLEQFTRATADSDAVGSSA
jgi:curved DNA-binding protein